MERDQTEDVVCIHCGMPTSSKSEFCEHCQAPQGPYATLDPLQTIQSQGFVFRQAAGFTAGLVSVIVVWLLFLGALVVPILRVVERPRLASELWIPVLCWVILGYMTYRITRSYVKKVAILDVESEKTENDIENQE